MKTTFGQRVLVTALAGALGVLMVGCDKPSVGTGAPAPGTTIGTEIDDSVVTTRVKTALLNDLDVKSFDFKVETNKGEVLLSGFVDNQYQLDRAVSIARSVVGVKNVDNKVSLKGNATTVGNKVDDGIITTKVKAALLADERVKSLDINVITRKTEVQLSGFVNNQSQMDFAVEIARGIEGVSRVSNDMKLKK